MALRSRCSLLTVAVSAGVLLSGVSPANGQDSLAVDWSVLPFVIYNPETSLSIGALYARVVAAPASPQSVRSSLTVNAQYTLKNQVVGGLNLEHRPENGGLLLANASARLSWPDRFYPPGNKAGRDAYEDWTARSLEGRVRFLRPTGNAHLFLGPMVHLRITEVVETEEGGFLEGGGIEGSEDHALAGLGFAATWDSRISPVYPVSGAFHSMTLTAYRSLYGDPRWVLSAEVDLRRYLALGRRMVLALRGRARSSWGDVPFTMHAALGGLAGGLRGIYETRYADPSAVLAVAELRRRLFWRMGGVAFGGLGQVAHDPQEWGIKGLHGAAGFGLRFALLPDSGLNLGVDFAFGEGESNVYFLLGEVF